jgi:phospholipid/cholesterol/gamma-HCH transport system substrate-binding protein
MIYAEEEEMLDIEKQLRWSKLRVGLVITLALFTLIVAVFFAGGIEEIFSPKIELKAQFWDVKGLRKGAPVWIFGTEIGSVRDINLDPIYGTIVTLSINKSVMGFIKKDSQASILTMGLLGDKYIELSPGSPQSGPIHPRDMIKGATQIELKDVMETSAMTVEKMTEFITKLGNLVTKIERGEGTVAKFLTDPSIYNNLSKATQTLSTSLEDIKNSKGTLKMLIEDPSFYNKMLAATSQIEAFSRKLSEGHGTLQRLVEDPSLYNKMLAATSQIEAFSRKLSEGHGTLQRLVEDPSLYNKMLAATSQIEAFSRKLSEEHGTLQRLVEDPELYENLQKGSKQLSTILERIDQGEGLAGALIRDEELTREVKETFVKFQELTVEIDALSMELKALVKDMKDHPKKYFKFSIF